MTTPLSTAWLPPQTSRQRIVCGSLVGAVAGMETPRSLGRLYHRAIRGMRRRRSTRCPEPRRPRRAYHVLIAGGSWGCSGFLLAAASPTQSRVRPLHPYPVRPDPPYKDAHDSCTFPISVCPRPSCAPLNARGTPSPPPSSPPPSPTSWMGVDWMG